MVPQHPVENQKKVSEQREVTVLVLDIVNFTGVSHRLESEDVYLFINEAMQVFVNVLKKYSGVIDKFTGDGLIALFGAPMAHENDPELAVRAGLEMLEVLAPLQKQVLEAHDFRLQVRIGIHTGFAIAGRLGSNLHQEYTVIGETVTLATQLESASQPDAVLASEETYRRTSALFHYSPVPGLQLKGMTEAVIGYSPLRLRRRPGRVRGLAGIETPMMGRSDELAQLSQALANIQQSRQGHVVLISGEAGLGKSRLVVEFRKLLETNDVQSYLGTNYPHARSVPYAALSHLLQDIFQISENDSAEIQYNTLVAQFDTHIGLDIHNLPYILNILGLERFDPTAQEQIRQLDSQMLQRQTFVAMRRLLAGKVKEKPLVLFVDDIHWIDASSRELLLNLVRAASDLPILFVLISRPVDNKSPAHSLLEEIDKHRERVTDIQLKALPLVTTQELLSHIITVADDQGKRVIKSIAARADGIPYYMEELVRMLIDKTALVKNAEGGYRALAEAETLLFNVPGTLAGLLMARFDSLDEESRQILQKAVVLGRSFPVPLLQELCQLPLSRLNTILNGLESKLFLRAEDFGNQRGYVFGHTLVRSTIHSTLLRRTRRVLHGQVAAAIERKGYFGKDDQMEALGYHYAESENPQKAIPYLIVSAENAALRGAHEIALDNYRRCLAIKPGIESNVEHDYCRIQLGMGRTLKFLGELTEAIQRLNETVNGLEQNELGTQQTETLLVETLTELGDAYLRVGQSDEAWARLEHAYALLQKSMPPDTDSSSHRWTVLLDRMAWARLRQGELNEAVSLAQQALAGADTNNNANPGLFASLYNILGGVYYQKGIPARAIQYVRMSLNLYKELDYSWGVASTLSNLGVLYYMQGLWSEAAEYYEKAETIRREHGFAAERALNLYNLALLRATMGEHQRAIESYEASLKISQQLGDHKVIGCCYIGLGQLADIEERVDDLRKYVDTASSYVAAFGDDHKTHLRLLQARLQSYAGDFESAIGMAMSALGLAEIAGLSEEIVDAHRMLGTLYRAAKKYDQAEKSLRYSLKLSEQRNDPYHQGLGELEMAQLLLEIPSSCKMTLIENRRTGQVILGHAIDHFEQVGATYFLGLAQKVLETLTDFDFSSNTPREQSALAET